MRRLLSNLRNWKKSLRPWHPLITIEIKERALRHNLDTLKRLAPQWQIAPVLKSNAYGHGLCAVAGILEHVEHIPFLCVDSYFEAEMIRREGIRAPLLILGHSSLEAIERNRWRGASFVVGSLEQLATLAAHGTRQSIHVKFDTGMHRQGIPFDKLGKALRLMKEGEKKLNVEGILSHFADASTPNSTITETQITRWNIIARRIHEELPSIRFYHIANSAGFAHTPDIIANVGRPGIALYGINPGNLAMEFEPALRMRSVVSDLRILKKGDTAGYGAAFIAPHAMKIATVPVGYFEGIDRRLSSRGAFLLNGQVAPLVGYVSMNISLCDVTHAGEVAIGDSVTVISDHPADVNSIERIARECGTIPYETLVRIPAHLRRTVI
ncbi:MAG: alanine racemase [Candidatus Brennerbacteria bacterium]|nr:alanine racemase [Candidatus Brennerbacteria bacterium]